MNVRKQEFETWKSRINKNEIQEIDRVNMEIEDYLVLLQTTNSNEDMENQIILLQDDLSTISLQIEELESKAAELVTSHQEYTVKHSQLLSEVNENSLQISAKETKKLESLKLRKTEVQNLDKKIDFWRNTIHNLKSK
eukprot:GHVP01061882.1.p1 GENE.GHVP01061882.1~~GHVP01061882.1.p1  ORF type:complete len:138 (-),score=36.01 GHVP01061882.1:686-1099(-)